MRRCGKRQKILPTWEEPFSRALHLKYLTEIVTFSPPHAVVDSPRILQLLKREGVRERAGNAAIGRRTDGRTLPPPPPPPPLPVLPTGGSRRLPFGNLDSLSITQEHNFCVMSMFAHWMKTVPTKPLLPTFDTDCHCSHCLWAHGAVGGGVRLPL